MAWIDNIGIQKKREELAKTFITIRNKKKTLVSTV